VDEIELLRHIDQAMNNSFEIIVGNTTMEDMMMNTSLENLVFAHDIELGHTKEDIENMNNHFIEKEDFEKCVILSKLM
tara:strand:+ start:5457 stop:5690 length:234 start_codon:yes stop_codon:yes gene_type:complete